jgi:carbon-monoxide dehydrogenase small subunit
VLGAAAAGRDVQTVESLSDGEQLHPVQRAFVDAGAVQCGFCTPGLVISTYALLKRNPEPSDQEVREALSGNICRCTGYGKILEAVQRSSIAMYRR